MLKFLLLAAVLALANGQNCLSNTGKPGGQDVSNAAYIFANANGNFSNSGNKCEMRLCPGDVTVPLWNTTYINFIKGQMCNSTDSTYMGCSPDRYVDSSLVSATWYNQGCEFCSSTCDATNADPTMAWIAMKRNPNHLRFFETNYDGRRCHMMQCSDTGCVDSTRSPSNITEYAFYPKSGMPQFVFPHRTDPFRTITMSSWTEFDVPNSYDCGQTQPSPSGFLCDQGSTNTTFWTGARSWNWVAPNCEVFECQGSDAMAMLYSTAEIGTATIKAPWRNYIATMCASQLRGCLNDVTKWYWGQQQGIPAPGSSDCAAPTSSASNFCSKLTCTCNVATDQKVYTIQTNSGPFTGYGVVLPVSVQTCYEGTCLAADTATPIAYGTLMSQTYSTFDRSYWRPITMCPSTQYYFTGATASPMRATVHGGVPIAYRLSTNRNDVIHDVQAEYYCSALGYTTIPVTAAKCYRSNLYSLVTSSPNSTSILGSGTGGSSCYPYLVSTPRVTGNCLTTPFGSKFSCISADRSLSMPIVEYQSADVTVYNKRWVEYQCFPNASNFRMETNCQTTPNDKAREFVASEGSGEACYANLDTLNAIREVTCTSPSNLSSTASPTWTTDLLMQTHQCDAFVFQKVFGKIASCECQRVTSLGSGGDAAYADQLKQMFKVGYETKVSALVGTLEADLRKLGCTYRATCTGGSGSVTVVRPKFQATFIVRTTCKSVDWVNLRGNLQTVFDNYQSVANGDGRFGGIQIDPFKATDTTDPAQTDPKLNKLCHVPFWTYFRNPEEGKWFHGNLTQTGAGIVSPLPTNSIVSGSAIYTGNSASGAAAAPANGAATLQFWVACFVAVLSLVALN